MSFFLTSLPPLPHSSPSRLSKQLPDLHPLFFVPPLEDRPQNPIVDTLVDVSSPPDLSEQSEHGIEFRQPDEVDSFEDEEENLWAAERLFLERSKRKNQNLSWDALRSTFPKHPTSTPFLSEQLNDAFDAVRHHVRSRLDDPSLQLRYILPAELLALLTINMVGNSSPLYVWDAASERFVSNGTGQDKKLVVIIEGLDDVASASIIQRFLTIGTLMRRLETLVVTLQRRNTNPTMHAFSHALSTILVHTRTSLTQHPPHLVTHLTSLWLHYADAEAILSVLATLCCREEDEHLPYGSLPDSPAGLLSHIYKHLEKHIECRSPRTITAIVAYILTTASRDYFTTLGESLGLYEPTRAPCLRTNVSSRGDRRRTNDLLQLDDIDLEQSTASSFSDTFDESDMPSFVPRELAEALPAARKSLRILQAADPDHHLCSTPAAAICEWVWSSAAVERIWECREIPGFSGHVAGGVLEGSQGSPLETSGVREYKLGLEQFRLFDLEPGTHLTNSATVPKSLGFRSSLETFLASFPARLPALTPNLQHLAKVVLQPLFTRTEVLSSSLLTLFLTSLRLETHLTLLRSYMLLTLPSFKTRLVDALFSDTDEYRPVGRGTRGRTLARLGLQDRHEEAETADIDVEPGIGLGHGLAEKNTWPPGGADLSFFLRTVIVDSLEERRDISEGGEAENVWREAGVRMGFALRDLPVSDGRERWLNPMSIEALDFLYLDYKPPHPLDVVITPDILSKYQRIFTFLLRFLRAETVARIAFRTAFKSGGPVFPYAPQAQKLLIRMRFQIHAFLAAFMTYIFDSAIGGNFDGYMHRLAELRNDVAEDSPASDEREITDVFSLERSHSNLLDRILSGCLLRTVQRTAGDALRDLLELILQFSVLVMGIRRGSIREAQGAEDLQELYQAFQKQMLVFIKAVQVLDAKGQGDKFISSDDLGHMHGGLGQTGNRSPFSDLLVRIDATGWWRRDTDRQNRRAV